MKNIFHILLILINISINYSFHFNNIFLSRRNILNYALFSPTIINDNIQMNNLYSNNNTDYDKPNIYINKKLNKEDFANYHKKSHLYSKSNIFFNGELNDESCFKLSEALLNHKNNLILNSDQGNHINLYIQSPGGSLLPTLGVVDEILNSEIPVYTYIRGYAASAATLLSVAGKHRLMYNHSLMMVHCVRTHQEVTTYNEVKDIYENLDVFMKIIKDIYLDNSNIDEKLLDELLLKDSWLTSSQSLKYGLIDEIL
uniref:ATP-dependent Clp protease proteolytic subunit n=1 Tax=Nucleocytoviricota sp. TaxID=2809609 RepID=A0A9E8G6P5_9VIRU|nr:ATP-dependent Clp protease proteolytic subunit [Nucleocytoviricota sp.]